MTKKVFFMMRLNDHIQYMKKISATLEGKGQFRGTDHKSCKLGQWLYGDGPKEVAAMTDTKAQELFNALLEPHERFHQASKRALDLQEVGNAEGCKQAVTEMHVLSNVISQKLLELDVLR